MKRRLLLLTLLFAAIAPQGKAAEIVFKLRDFAEKPVPGRIEMAAPQKGQESSVTWITLLLLDTGDGRLPNAKCDRPGIFFRAFSYDQTYYLELSEMMKSCTIGEIVFHFRRKDYASVLSEALSSDTQVIAAAPQHVKELHTTVIAALKVANYPVAATKSMLLRDEIEKQFGRNAAEPFRVLSEDVAASPIARGQPLVFDPPQKKYVFAPETVQEIAKYQKSVGVESNGIMTWATARKLPDISNKEVAGDLYHDHGPQ